MDFLELQRIARSSTRAVLPGVGETVLKRVNPLERLLKSGSFASAIEMELVSARERENRLREMIEDQPDLADRWMKYQSDEVTVCLGIAGPYHVRLDGDAESGEEAEFSFSEWLALVGHESAALVVARVKALSGDSVPEEFRLSGSDDAWKGRIKDRLATVGMLQKECGIRASEILRGSELDLELDLLCHAEFLRAQGKARFEGDSDGWGISTLD